MPAPSGSCRSGRTGLLGLRASGRRPYIDRQAVAEEVAFSRRLCAKHNWPSIDVTRRSIEETAAAVMALLAERRRHPWPDVMALWLPDQPLVLASKSEVRRTILEAAGIPVEVRPADIDERAIEAGAGGAPSARHCAAAGAGEGPDGCRRDAGPPGPRRRPDAGAWVRDSVEAARPGRGARAAAAHARANPRASFGNRGCARQDRAVRARRHRAADDAALFGRLPRPLSGGRRDSRR